jgi:hypothetical protein
MANPPPRRPRAREKDLDKMVKRVWDAGWRCERRSSNYIFCYPPMDGPPVVVKSTPSGSRYRENLRLQFKRAGLDL